MVARHRVRGVLPRYSPFTIHDSLQNPIACCWLVYMQRSPAMVSAFLTTLRDNRSSRAAPAPPPARMRRRCRSHQPCSGSRHRHYRDHERGFAVRHAASLPRRRMRSVPSPWRFDAERMRLPWCFSSFASKRSNNVNASAVPPANPARSSRGKAAGLTRPRLDHYVADVTSIAASATRAPRRTDRMSCREKYSVMLKVGWISCYRIVDVYCRTERGSQIR